MTRLLAIVALVWLVWPGHARADEGLAFSIAQEHTPRRMCPGERTLVDLELVDDGLAIWSDGQRDRVAYHWREADGALRIKEGRRTTITGPVLPGQHISVRARLDAPDEPGTWLLQWAMVREHVAWFPEPAGARVRVEVAGDAPTWGWAIDGVPSEPLVAAAGERVELPVVLTDVGCVVWDRELGDALSYHLFDGDGRQLVRDGLRTPLPDTERGAAASLRAGIDLALAPGRYTLVLEPLREHLRWFGAPIRGNATRPVVVEPGALAWSVVAGEPLPATGFAGQQLVVHRVIRNEGDTAWRPEDDRLSYRVLDERGHATAFEGTRTPLPDIVEPGDTIELRATVTLPDRPGRYRIEWQPVREHVRWFGPAVGDDDGLRDAEVVDVGPPQLAWAVESDDLGARLWAARTTVAHVRVRNIGGDRWSPAAGDRLSVRWRDADGNELGVEGMRSELPGEVAPGESVEVALRIHAPAFVGAAELELAMVREHVAWFPAPSGARRSVRLVWAGATTTVAVTLVVLLVGVGVARVRAGTRLADLIAQAFVPVAVALVLIAIGESFADLSGIEPWVGTHAVAVSSAAWCVLPLLLVPVRRRALAAVPLVTVAIALALVDLGYLDFFGSIVPLSAVVAVHHLGDAHATVFSLWRPEYALIPMTLVPLVAIVVVAPRRSRPDGGRSWTVVLATLLLAALPTWLGLRELAESGVAARVFSERDNVGRLGLWNAHGFEALRTVGRWLGADRLTPARREEVARITARASAARGQPRANTAVAQGANLVVIQAEALQAWVVDAEIGGAPVMPFVRGLADANLFVDVVDQTAQGRTSDAEYLVLQSNHPLRTGALAFLRADDRFDTIAHRLTAAGYDTLSAHPYARGFWNRAVLHRAYGFTTSLFREEIGAGEQVGWGLSDREFLARMADVLAERPQPFFAFFITLGLHHPYAEFPAALAELDTGELTGSPLGNYLQGMRHLDGALAGFFAALARAGLADHTVVVIYGDHVAGLPETPALLELAGIPRWDPTVPMRLHRVPALVVIPGVAGGRRSDTVGQIDLGPTALDVLGVEAPPAFVGRSVFSAAPHELALPDGSAIAADRMWIARGRDDLAGGGCFDRDGHGRPREDCTALEQRIADELWASRAVLDHDLFRSLEHGE